jgi:hypothetical protein
MEAYDKLTEQRVLSLSFRVGGPAPSFERAQTKVSHRAPKAPRVPTKKTPQFK